MNDPTWQALLTARALGTVPDLHENERRYLRGEITLTEFSNTLDLWDDVPWPYK